MIMNGAEVQVEKWKFSKSVSLGHLITVCMFVIGTIAYAVGVDNSTITNSLKIDTNKELVSIHLGKIDKRFDIIDNRFDRMDKRLDTIISIILKQK